MKSFILTIAFLAGTANAQADVWYYTPTEGGPVTLFGRQIGLQGFDIIDTTGRNRLYRTEGVPQPLPFTFFVTPLEAGNSFAQITVGNLGTTYNLDGEVTLAGFGALPGCWGFQASVGIDGEVVPLLAFCPEPGGNALFALGLAGLLAIRSKRNAA